MTDHELLLDFTTHRSQAAFHQLVERHTPWLYSVCLRRLRDPALAEDATQAVFLALAQKAPALTHEPTLSPWLHQVAKYVAANILRANARRARHESEAAAMTPTQSAAPQWQDIEADLEPALDRLPFADRQMLLLRFYEHKSHPEIAALLNISEAAAAKRLERALARLRAHLAPTTTTSANLSTAALASLLHTHTVLPLPATLAASTAAASAGTTTLAKGALLAMATAKLQTAIIVVAACLLITIPAAVITLHHRTHPVAAAVTPIAAPADPPPASAPQVSAFDQTYALAPGELVKHIPDAPAEIRDPFIREHFSSSQASRASLFIGWIGNDTGGYSFFGARRYTLAMLAEQILGLESLEIEGNLAKRSVNGGDFSYSQSPFTTPDQLCAALQKILQDDFQLPATLQFRDVPRKIVVLRGKWKFTPNPDVPNTNSPTGPFGLPLSCVDIYGGDPFDKDSTLTASGSGPARTLASNLADWIHQQVIIEATGFPPLFGYRCHSPRANDPDALAHDRDSVLKHITDQTALTWSEETRTVHRLFIESTTAQ